jgi:ABC-type multidrug transport system fused ATPase/permease subunit
MTHATTLLKTQVRGGGVGLSRGQSQLLCLARALVVLHREISGEGVGISTASHNIILVDEATAALDQHSESLILTALKDSAEATRATMLIITHDPDRLPAGLVSRHLTLKDGRLVEPH